MEYTDRSEQVCGPFCGADLALLSFEIFNKSQGYQNRNLAQDCGPEGVERKWG